MFSDIVLQQLEERFDEVQRVDVLVEIVRLCEDPAGKHPLSAPLSGWNTLDILTAKYRVVYKATVVDEVGLIEVLCVGPRSDSEVYDMAVGIVSTGLLSEDEVTQLWEALNLLDVLTEDIGLEGWDYRPEPAPEGMRRAAISSGLLDRRIADLLSKDEITVAMTSGWGPNGPDPEAALVAALERARGSADFSERRILEERRVDRCGALMVRAKSACVRRQGHPGPHRSG
ncbi:MAG: type II toxin-antitoxin system RelE family toxin [Acidimicrobiales bacterium]